MANTEDNLLFLLHKWARRQDENFHTAALVYLLNHLRQFEPTAAANILKKVTDGTLELASQDVHSVIITTQARTPRGFYPDIEIKSSEHLIYIEVKVESGLGPLQLKNYRHALNESNCKNTSLILLTRYPVALKEGEEKPDFVIRWHQIAEWLEHETIHDPLSVYVVKQFLEFLQGRGITMGRVTEELAAGLQSLRNLMKMNVSRIFFLKV